jgi:hypothetical protein
MIYHWAPDVILRLTWSQVLRWEAAALEVAEGA